MLIAWDTLRQILGLTLSHILRTVTYVTEDDTYGLC